MVNRKEALGVIERRRMSYGCLERLLEWLPIEILHVWSGYKKMKRNSRYPTFKFATSSCFLDEIDGRWEIKTQK